MEDKKTAVPEPPVFEEAIRPEPLKPEEQIILPKTNPPSLPTKKKGRVPRPLKLAYNWAKAACQFVGGAITTAVDAVTNTVLSCTGGRTEKDD